MRDCKPAMLVQQRALFFELKISHSHLWATLHFAKSVINTTSKKIPYRIVAASGGPGIRMAAFIMEASLHDVAPGSARHDIFFGESFCRPFKCHCLEFLLEGLRIVRTWVLYINLYKPFLLHIFIISSMYHVCIFYL